jgi:hypothetical protein
MVSVGESRFWLLAVCSAVGVRPTSVATLPVSLTYFPRIFVSCSCRGAYYSFLAGLPYSVKTHRHPPSSTVIHRSNEVKSSTYFSSSTTSLRGRYFTDALSAVWRLRHFIRWGGFQSHWPKLKSRVRQKLVSREDLLV